jgi:hypothetical protein
MSFITHPMPNAASSTTPSTPVAPPTFNRAGEVLLWLVLTLLAINLPEKPVLELDSSWRQALAYFFHRGYPFGESVVFTYGPLGFLMGNTFTGLYFWSYVVFQVTFSAIAATMIVQVGRPLTGLSRFAYFAFFLLWGVGYPDAFHMIMIAFAGWMMINRITDAVKVRPVLFGLFLAFLAVIKFTNLLFTGFVVVVVTAYAWRKNDRKSASWLLATFTAGFLVIWAACGQSLTSLPAYAINSLSVSKGYEAAMGLPTPDGQLTTALIIFAAGAVYVVWHLFSQPDLIRSSAQLLILAAFLFLNWKHGFVRADGHMLGFFYCALVPAVAFPALFREQTTNPVIPRVCLLLVMFFCLKGMHGTFHTTIEYAPNIAHDDLLETVRAFGDFDQFHRDLQGQVDDWHRKGKLAKIQKLVGEASVDVLGFEQAIALFNDFNYTPRPVFQSYTVYTPRLSALNADFITSEHAPEFFLLKLQVIDERPLMMDDSQLMNFFPHLYTFKALENGFYLFQKRAEHPPIDSLRPRLLRAVDQPLGQPLSLAEYGAEHIWLEIDLPLSLLGRARNFLYKPALVQLRVVTSFGEILTYRLPLTSAQAGFQISPHITDFESYLEAHGGSNPRKVESITLLVADEDRRFFSDTATVMLSRTVATDTNHEYAQQIERGRFNLFSQLPVDFKAATPASNVEIGGSEALVMHAPSFMTFTFKAGTARVTGAHGYPVAAYTNGGETDGAVFTVTWTDGTERRELYRREIDPLKNELDRGLLPFSLDTSTLPDGQILFETSIRSHPGWDWTAWADLNFK